MAEPRFDVSFGEHGPSVDYHFCREWTIDADGKEVGCYGTNPDHGLSFDEAKEQIADWHEREAARWRTMTLKEWERVPETCES